MASNTWQDYLKSVGIDPTTSTTQQQNKQLQQPDYGTLGALGGVLGAYSMGNDVSQGLGRSNGQLDQQINTLQDMYNPNGVVAQQMAQELAAKDAAAGRNSQYGMRSALLQAQLAKGATQNAQTIGTLQGQRNQNNLQQNQVQAQQLASLFNLADKSGYLAKANTGLNGIFGPMERTPQASDYGAGGPSMGVYGVPQSSGPIGSEYGNPSFAPQAYNDQGQLGSGTWSPATDNTMNDTAPQQWGSGAGTNFLDF